MLKLLLVATLLSQPVTTSGPSVAQMLEEHIHTLLDLQSEMRISHLYAELITTGGTLYYLEDGEERDDLLLDFNRFVDALNDELDAKRERHKIMKHRPFYHPQGEAPPKP